MNREISDQAWRALSLRLGLDEPALRAIAEVESAGSGFLPRPSEDPRILFEGHAFHRLTKGRFSSSHPDLSYPKWTKEHYARTAAGEWDRLRRARELDRDAANQSASWGAFQIMGFNYGLCGFSNVEAFVAAQRSGAPEQLEVFAQFVARDLFLVPLRQHDWKAFARAYNGPAFAKNRYDERLAAAYAKHGGAAGRTPATARTIVAVEMPGRPEFAPPPAGAQRAAIIRPVKPDAVDLRDWVYRPTIAVAPPPRLLPRKPRPTTNQGESSACTGFALGKVIEYLLQRARRPVDPISGYMLYSMARRYDEWTADDDSGSSLRGALKGWSRHGASAADLWTQLDPPTPSNAEGDDWWLDSVTRPIGAYYRLTLDALTDMQVALMESGAVYASAFTHGGWDDLLATRTSSRRGLSGELPVIEPRPGQPDAGHAFAIVGYTDRGFVVQNSWGPKWGRDGFGILTYADWCQNAMDAWVVQLGVVTREHEELSREPSLRLVDARSGRVVMSTSPTLSAHEVSPFVVDMQNEGCLSDRGQFRTLDSDLVFLLDHHLNTVARRRWGSSDRNRPIDVALYAHGGLVDEAAAAESARRWVPLFYSNQIFPIFLMWETDLLSTVFNRVEDVVTREELRVRQDLWSRFQARVRDWKDERIEGLVRTPGGVLWRQVTQNAKAISTNEQSGVRQLFALFARRKARLPRVRLHLVGHSAGALVHCHLAARALQAGLDVASISFIAPAVRVDTFEKTIGKAIARGAIRTLVAHLTDDAERSDPSCSPYGRSLLYLASRAFEDQIDAPVLGMEKHLVPALVSHKWGTEISRLASPGAAYRAGDRLTVANTHGGMDDDFAVQEAVIRHIKGPAFTGSVLRPVLGGSRRSDEDVPEETPSTEARVVTRLAARKG